MLVNAALNSLLLSDYHLFGKYFPAEDDEYGRSEGHTAWSPVAPAAQPATGLWTFPKPLPPHFRT